MTFSKSLFLLSYICIASISAAIITPALPVIEGQYHLGNGAIEWIVSIFLVGYTIGQLIYGPIANRFGRLHALRTGLIISILGIALCWVSVPMHSYGFLLAGRLLNALGAAAGLSCTFLLINELSKDEKQVKSTMALSIASFTTGVGLAVAIGGAITQYIGWPWVFMVLLIHNAFMFLGTWAFKETLTKPKPLHVAHLLKSYICTLKSFKLVCFSVCMGLTTLITYAYSAAAPLIAHGLLHISPADYGYWTLLPLFASFISGVGAKYLMNMIEPWKVILIGVVGVITGLISLFWMHDVSSTSAMWFFFTMAWLYFIASIIMPAGAFYASNAISDKASASSMMSFLNMSTALIGVIVLGYIPGGSFNAFNILCSVVVGIVVLLLALYAITNSGE